MKKIFMLLSLAVVIALSLLSNAKAQRPEGRRPVMPVQAALDTDTDGVISSAEIAQAPAALRKLDKNGDGKLTEDEVRPNFERRGNGNGQDENSAATIVNSLLEFDQNKDGKLSKQEVPNRMQGIFARGDANQDGFLTKDELQKMAATPTTTATNNTPPNLGEFIERPPYPYLCGVSR